ncbi:hypothetical protein LIER_31061 [Lithospermum erythrorhizon]|uniref:Uncharacterized protein n=1 Tax=Lithospermum erythrorhizon TaxID=34254 RepID=A0AAV3RTQ8_LITER
MVESITTQRVDFKEADNRRSYIGDHRGKDGGGTGLHNSGDTTTTQLHHPSPSTIIGGTSNLSNLAPWIIDS